MPYYELTDLDGNRVLIQSIEEGGVLTAGPTDKLLKSIDGIGDFIASQAGELVTKVKEMKDVARPSSISITFSIGVDGELGLPFVAKGGADANFSITIEWSE